MGKWCQETFDQYIEFKDIDHLAHGRFIQNMKRGAKEASLLLNGMQGKAANPKLASILFCKVHDINSAAVLKQFYKEEMKRIRRKKGNRSKWEERVSKLSDYKIHSFLRPIK
jgi:hypothetical protein